MKQMKTFHTDYCGSCGSKPEDQEIQTNLNIM